MLRTRLIAGATSGFVLSAVSATLLALLGFGETFFEPWRVDPQRPHAQLTRQSSGHTLGPAQPQADHSPQILTDGGLLPQRV